MKKIKILGAKYTIKIRNPAQDKYLKEADGYCDKTTKTIVIAKEDTESELGNYEVYLKKVLRHEIIHAFLFESGLAENYQHADQYGQEETMVDWIAIQFPKLWKAFKKAGAL